MIDEFRGTYRFLSNFWPAKVVLDGDEYPTVEHAYQAAKCRRRIYREFIRAAQTPKDAKRLGRSMEKRRDWDEVKVSVMESLLRQKFSADPLRSMLLGTGDQPIVEGNTWGDTFWGVCNGRGDNRLGYLLMAIRDEIRQQSA